MIDQKKLVVTLDFIEELKQEGIRLCAVRTETKGEQEKFEESWQDLTEALDSIYYALPGRMFEEWDIEGLVYDKIADDSDAVIAARIAEMADKCNLCGVADKQEGSNYCILCDSRLKTRRIASRLTKELKEYQDPINYEQWERRVNK